MNDRFKFRAWYCDKDDENDSNNNKMFYNAQDTYDCLGGNPSLGASSFGDIIDDECWVVEQCTGLKDKNGKLIYEGDIVKIIDKSSRKEPFIGVVEYTNTASFEANCNGFYMYLHNPKTPENVSMIEKIFCTSLREIEVIGNIHENADLLEYEE